VYCASKPKTQTLPIEWYKEVKLLDDVFHFPLLVGRGEHRPD